MKYAGKIDATATDTYRFLNFDKFPKKNGRGRPYRRKLDDLVWPKLDM
jgi:hypothetical protein